jgi:CRP-like cAMP-binding protein
MDELRATVPGSRTSLRAPSHPWFGEAAACTEQPRRIGLTATRDPELLQLPLHAIREIVAADPGAWRYFGLAAIAHYDVAIGAADDLLIRDHVKRSVAVLLRRAAPPRTPPGAFVSLRESRHYVGEGLGLQWGAAITRTRSCAENARS